MKEIKSHNTKCYKVSESKTLISCRYLTMGVFTNKTQAVRALKKSCVPGKGSGKREAVFHKRNAITGDTVQNKLKRPEIL
jgi:hypothetical protein